MKLQHRRNKRNIIESSPFLQFMYHVTNFGAVIFSTKKLKCYIRTSNSDVLYVELSRIFFLSFGTGNIFVWSSMKRREKYNLFHFFYNTAVVMVWKMVCVTKNERGKTRRKW